MSISDKYLNKPFGSFESIFIAKNCVKQDFKGCYIQAKLNQKPYQIFYAQIGQVSQWSTNPDKIQLRT